MIAGSELLWPAAGAVKDAKDVNWSPTMRYGKTYGVPI
jgi:hypothetical protein